MIHWQLEVRMFERIKFAPNILVLTGQSRNDLRMRSSMIFTRLTAVVLLFVTFAPSLRAQYVSPWDDRRDPRVAVFRQKLREKRVPVGVFVASVSTASPADRLG